MSTADPHHEAPMTEVLGLLRDEGFDGDVSVPEPDGEPVLRCGACRNDAPPADFIPGGSWRFEGTSDPDDMAIVVALTCPSCGGKGVLVASYGPEIPLEVADAITLIPDHERRSG